MKWFTALLFALFSSHIWSGSYELEIGIETDGCDIKDSDRIKVAFFRDLSHISGGPGNLLPALQLSSPTTVAALPIDRPSFIKLSGPVTFMIIDFGGISTLTFPCSGSFAWPEPVNIGRIMVRAICKKNLDQNDNFLATTLSAEIAIFDRLFKPIEPGYEPSHLKWLDRLHIHFMTQKGKLKEITKRLDLKIPGSRSNL